MNMHHWNLLVESIFGWWPHLPPLWIYPHICTKATCSKGWSQPISENSRATKAGPILWYKGSSNRCLWLEDSSSAWPNLLRNYAVGQTLPFQSSLLSSLLPQISELYLGLRLSLHFPDLSLWWFKIHPQILWYTLQKVESISFLLRVA